MFWATANNIPRDNRAVARNWVKTVVDKQSLRQESLGQQIAFSGVHSKPLSDVWRDMSHPWTRSMTLGAEGVIPGGLIKGLLRVFGQFTLTLLSGPLYALQSSRPERSPALSV